MVRRFVFVLPEAAGHTNPTLPLARALVGSGHEVHYLCSEIFREAIEDTGAFLHATHKVLAKLCKGRGDTNTQVQAALIEEHGLQDDSALVAIFKVGMLRFELQIPDLLHFLKELNPAVVVYDAYKNPEAALAANHLSIPSAGFLSLPGPGCLPGILQELLSPEQMEEICSFEPRIAAEGRIQALCGLSRDVFCPKFDGIMRHLQLSVATLVTTIEELQDPMTADLAEFYHTRGVKFVSVGPLLGPSGAKRVGGHKTNTEEAVPAEDASGNGASEGTRPEDLVERVRLARQTGRRVVLVSMGTVLVGDHPEYGWEGRPKNAEGQAHGLTGRELCQGAWGAAFDAFGAQSSEEGPLIVVSLGPQPHALGQLVAPPNAVCLPVVPQVDVLNEGVDAFLTHGGQNSFTESLASGTPVLVCPGFADQPLTAQKAVSLGVGLKVDRPKPAIGEEVSAAQHYREEVSMKFREVVSKSTFKERVLLFQGMLQKAGGLAQAAEVVLAAASSRSQYQGGGA